MNRRRLLVFAAAAAAALPALAWADDNHLPLAKAFPLLDTYLGLPPAERSRFYLAYRAVRDKKPVAGVHATLVAANGARSPVGFDGLGVVTRLPSLAELKSGATFEIAGAPFKLVPELRCAMAPAMRLDPTTLALALVQVNAAVQKVAGALSLMVPKLTAAYFPDAGGGQTLLGDGRTTPLPVFTAPIFGQIAYFEPAKAVGAKAVLLTRAPSRILLGGHPKAA
jgi:hypothetical protein